MVDSVYRTRSLGVAAEGLPDQYADGKAARVWELYIGSKQARTDQYQKWFCNLLKEKKCLKILDVACGTGVDSIMLLEAGFDVMSTDASDKMLKYALKERWARRREAAFDKWVIEEANWLSLADDLLALPETPSGGFDAVVCLGNSFAHLPDFDGDLRNQKLAFKNFKDMLKPGGILVIDHRNYDEILKTGTVPAKNIYYNSSFITDMKVSNLYVNGRPTLTTLDYVMDISTMDKCDDQDLAKWNRIQQQDIGVHKFRLSYYPHQVNEFSKILKEVFGADAKHSAYGDFKPHGEIQAPAYFIHTIEKKD